MDPLLTTKGRMEDLDHLSVNENKKRLDAKITAYSGQQDNPRLRKGSGAGYHPLQSFSVA